MSHDELIELRECPPGLFEFDGILGFKTEYGASIGKDAGGGKVEWTVTNFSDVYVVASGETFWAGAKTHEERDRLLVQPVEAAALTTIQDREATLIETLEWIEAFAQVRAKDDSKVFARVNRGALRTIAAKCDEALGTSGLVERS